MKQASHLERHLASPSSALACAAGWGDSSARSFVRRQAWGVVARGGASKEEEDRGAFAIDPALATADAFYIDPALATADAVATDSAFATSGALAVDSALAAPGNLAIQPPRGTAHANEAEPGRCPKNRAWCPTRGGGGSLQ
jgi:hypothetical protein